MEAILAELEPLLAREDKQVFLRAYCISFTSGQPVEWYITEALGPATVVGGVTPVTRPEILAHVGQCLQYARGLSSGPKSSARLFKRLVATVASELDRYTAEAELLAEFWLRNGHPANPAYPVFWNFAFVIAGPAGGLVFMGISSD